MAMKKRCVALACMLAAAVFLCGCVEVEQEVRMNHDGSGKIIEKYALSPRSVRMLEGAKKRGAGGGAPKLMSEDTFQARLKAFGDVTLESKNVVTLPDGRQQIQAVYSFKDANKVTFWTVPTMSYKKTHQHGGRLDGSLILAYNAQYSPSWAPTRIYKESVNIKAAGVFGLPPQDMSTPADRQKFERVLPIFLDMVSDLKLSIKVVAPIEDFEEKSMVWGLPVEHNRVTVYEVDGRGLAQCPPMMLQLIANEVIGGSDLGKNQESMPGVFTAWPDLHGGRGFRFMKMEVAKEGGEEEKPKEKPKKRAPR